MDADQAFTPLSRLACVMVGLPARGKTYMARKIVRYLTWLGHNSRVFNVGNYRRKAVGAHQTADFFDVNNEEYMETRTELAKKALQDMLDWLEAGGVDGQSLSTSSFTSSFPTVKETVTGEGVGSPSCVAIYDATNSTLDRRKIIYDACRKVGVRVFFIESVCDDQEIIMKNIIEFKLTSPDYQETPTEQAIADFQNRIKNYEVTYQPLSSDELENISFVKVIDAGKEFTISKESMFNVSGRIGGDSDLSPRGELFASKLPEVLLKQIGNKNITIWTSTLRRTRQTAANLQFPKLQWKNLDELSSGSCDGMTYEEIEKAYPKDFADRDTDKYNYRYHGGESYRDLVQRLEPVIMEIERHNDQDTYIYIVGHQAVVRAIYAYFHGISKEELPYIRIPLHNLIKLTPKAYKCLEERFVVDVPAVDTFRPRPTH